jgi:hypothetical protein
MKFNVKWARQGVMVALVAIAAAWMGAQVTVQQRRYPQVAGNGNGLNNGYLLVDDKTKLCAAGC